MARLIVIAIKTRCYGVKLKRVKRVMRAPVLEGIQAHRGIVVICQRAGGRRRDAAG